MIPGLTPNEFAPLSACRTKCELCFWTAEHVCLAIETCFTLTLTIDRARLPDRRQRLARTGTSIIAGTKSLRAFTVEHTRIPRRYRAHKWQSTFFFKIFRFQGPTLTVFNRLSASIHGDRIIENGAALHAGP